MIRRYTVISSSKMSTEPGAEVPSSVDWGTYHRRWNDIWDAGLSPGEGFDATKSSPALIDAIESGRVDVKGKRAFVPGCGRGYDVITLAQAGASSSVGLDYSNRAVEDARQYTSSQRLPTDVTARLRIDQGDFFSYSDPAGPFDVGYDYTFLCALHPSMRSDWATAWKRLLQPGGRLITMIFPVDPAMDVSKGYQGPPWPVTPEVYRDLLQQQQGFKCVYLEPVPPHLSNPSKRAGKEYLGIWERQ